MNRDVQIHQLRAMVSGAYDIQKLRIEVGNRLVGNFKAKLGQAPSESEDCLDEDAQALLADLRARYRRITDGVAEGQIPTPRKFQGDEVISSYTELSLLARYFDLERQEKQDFKRLGHVLEEFEIYRTWLSKVRGVGPAMAGVLLTYLDIHKAQYVTSFWRYAGYDVAEDGRGRSSRREHLVEREYTNAKGEQATRLSLTHNRFLKTKLYVLACSFMKQGSPYAAVYDNYRHRLEHRPDLADESNGRKHMMAIRYMMKMFLADFWEAWRRVEGMEVPPTYPEAKLHMPPHSRPRVDATGRDKVVRMPVVKKPKAPPTEQKLDEVGAKNSHKKPKYGGQERS